jgi:hypothetical protein
LWSAFFDAVVQRAGEEQLAGLAGGDTERLAEGKRSTVTRSASGGAANTSSIASSFKARTVSTSGSARSTSTAAVSQLRASA